MLSLLLFNNPSSVSSYIIVTDEGKKNWTDANNYCIEQFGTSLATINSDNDLQQIISNNQFVEHVSITGVPYYPDYNYIMVYIFSLILMQPLVLIYITVQNVRMVVGEDFI